jgi:Zn-dependent protease
MECYENWFISRILALIPLLLSLSVHEWAHAWTASLLGDDTAKHMGRLTLNPLNHIDPVGTLLLPLMGVPFGWAKPVPINPVRFRRDINMGFAIMLTALSGPLSNLLVALTSMALLFLCSHFLSLTYENSQALYIFLETLIFINIILALFNALPIAPLDGSRVVDSLIPNQFRPLWESFCQISPFVLIALIVLPFITGFSVLDAPIRAIQSVLGQLY